MSDTKAQKERKEARTIQIDAVISVIIDSFLTMFNNNPAQSAASISYYTLLSAFPLLLFMVIFLSYFLDVTVIQQQIINALQNILPGTETLVIENLQTILVNRGQTSLFASVMLLWSGSGAFNGIISNIQKAWPETRGRGYFINRFIAIASIILIVLVISALIMFNFVFNLSEALALFNIELNPFIQFLVRIFSSYVIPCGLLYLIGYLLYCYIPPVNVDRSAARIGAILFAILLRIFSFVFGMYLLSPLNRYDLVYGSVAVIVLALLYVYIVAFIVLYFAFLVAAITHYKQRKEFLTRRVSQIENRSARKPALKSAPSPEQQPISSSIPNQDVFVQQKQTEQASSIVNGEKSPSYNHNLPEETGNTSQSGKIETVKKFGNVKNIIIQFIKDLFRWK